MGTAVGSSLLRISGAVTGLLTPPDLPPPLAWSLRFAFAASVVAFKDTTLETGLSLQGGEILSKHLNFPIPYCLCVLIFCCFAV